MSRQLVLAFALCSSCATVQQSVPFPEGRPEEVRVVVEPGVGLPPASVPETAAAGTETLTVKARLVSVRASALDPSTVARITDRETARRFVQTLVDSEEASELNDTTLTLFDGTEGSLQVSNQTAYVARYEMHVTGDTAVADPCVEVVDDGLALRARVQRQGEAIALDLELTLADLDRPIAERRVELGSSAPVTVQAPSGTTRRVTTAPTLGPGEALLLGGPALPSGGGRILLALVEADRTPG